MANNTPSRHLEWEGCLNARDLGGLPTLDGGETRWQSVIRADYPGTLTPAGLEAMLDYGVRTLIDIRSPQEAAAECYQWAETSGCRRLHLPIEKYYPHVGVRIRQATSLVETYCIMVDAYPDCVAAILRAVAEAPPGGVLVHCQGGKDRTGTIVCAAAVHRRRARRRDCRRLCPQPGTPVARVRAAPAAGPASKNPRPSGPGRWPIPPPCTRSWITWNPAMAVSTPTWRRPDSRRTKFCRSASVSSQASKLRRRAQKVNPKINPR